MSDRNTVAKAVHPLTWPMAVVGIAGVYLVLLFLFRETYLSIVTTWSRSETFTHGFVILPISLYFIWSKRRLLAAQPLQPTWIPLLLIVAGAFVWLVMDVAGVLVIQQFTAVAMIPMLAWALLGHRAARVIAFPLAFLVFAVPMGESIIPVLQDFTAAFVVKTLNMTGMTVYWEGRFFHIASGSFEVAEACSGSRYLFASMTLGALYAYLNYRSYWRRALFFGLSIIVPIVANGVRAYGVVMLAHLSDYTVAVGVDHLIYGWIFFGLVILFLFWLGRFFFEPTLADKDEKAEQSDAGPAKATTLGSYLTWAVVGVLSFSWAPLFATTLEAGETGPAMALTLPTGEQGWAGPSPSRGEWNPSFHGAAAEQQGRYSHDGRPLELYLARYGAQHQGAELINSLNRSYDYDLWRRLGGYDHEFKLPDGRSWTAQVTNIISATGKTRMIWQWYEVAGTAYISPLAAKAMEVWATLSRDRRGSAVVLLAMDYDLNSIEARDRMEAYVKAMLSPIRQAAQGE